MPNEKKLTYGQLHQKLRELGFEEYGAVVDGKQVASPSIPGSRPA